MSALILTKLTREGHDREAAIVEPAGHAVDRGAGRAEHQRVPDGEPEGPSAGVDR